VWKIKDIPMRAFYKGKAANWTCESFEIKIQSYGDGFIINKCTANCGSYWGSYNCVTSPIIIEQNQLNYLFTDGKTKTIGNCNRDGFSFRNKRSIDPNETWPLVGDGMWFIGVTETELRFSFRLYTTKSENDFWEIVPVSLPISLH
jgi:hypothetical protein